MHALNATDIRVLRAVFDGRDRLPAVAAAAGLSLPRASVVLSGLAAKGLLEKTRRGMSWTVGFSDSRSAHLFRELLGSGFRAEEVMSDSKLTLLSVLAGNGGSLDQKDLLAFSGLSGGSVRAFIRAGIRYGVLWRDADGYAISTSARTLRAFLRSYEEDIAGRVAGAVSKNALVHRTFGFEVIFSLPEGESGGRAAPTAVTAFSADGVPTFGSRDYYHHAPSGRALRREDYIMDYIMLGPGSVQHLTISMIYLKLHRRRIDGRRLGLLSRVYGMPSLAGDMLRFVDDKALDIKGFPKRAEFDEKYWMYGGPHARKAPAPS
jgi:hypothetical protein